MSTPPTMTSPAVDVAGVLVGVTGAVVGGAVVVAAAWCTPSGLAW